MYEALAPIIYRATFVDVKIGVCDCSNFKTGVCVCSNFKTGVCGCSNVD